ncbi:MAG: PD-(D/E)XK nuclease family protein, partial [Chloroflexi bacterium]|nr:PD-(D/E)XK nuclease family protein [Chloroflexota bacterium]
EAIASDLRAMLISMHNGDLWRQIASSASIFRELDFSMDIAHGRLRGQIDLLFEDAGGWHIVDYKSDRTSTDDSQATHKRRAKKITLALGHYSCIYNCLLVDSSATIGHF